MLEKFIEETQHHLAVMSKLAKEESFNLESHLLLLRSCQLAQMNMSQIMYNLAKNTMVAWQGPNDSEIRK